MGLGYTPVVRVTGPHAGLINDRRLIDWEHIDAAGIESDRLHLTVDVRGVDGLPAEGDPIGIEYGYEESIVVDKGQFVISRVTPRLFPEQLLIVATAAPFRPADETAFRERRSESFEDTTLGAVFRKLAGRHGFSPRVASDVDGIPIVHADQSDETDMSFLTRLAREHDAVTKPINDRYVLARRGQVKSISGQDLPKVTLSVPPNNSPSEMGFTNATLERHARIKFGGVRAAWFDGEEGIEIVVESGGAPFKRLRQTYETKGEAELAAAGERRKIKREEEKLRVECPGNPSLSAEGPLELDDTWPSYMQGLWSLDRVTSRGSRRYGYRCILEATWPT